MKSKENLIGEILESRNCGKFKVKKVIGWKVEIEFIDTGFTIIAETKDALKGHVKDRLFRSVYGIGYFGIGVNKSCANGKINPAYRAWSKMLERCYSEPYQQKFQTYKGCTVCDEWHNFQTFAEWYNGNHPNDGGKYHLDKDLLSNGKVKIYSPETCLFLSPRDNTEIARAKNYTIKNSQGDVVKVYNMALFCRKNNLAKSSMCNLVNGKQKSHRGWVLA